MIHTLLTTPRSGSTWYGCVLALTKSAKFMNEVFHMDRSNQHKTMLMNILKTYHNSDKSCVIKFFPQQAANSPVADLGQLLLDYSSTVEILVRKDFASQLKSLYVAHLHQPAVPDGADGASTWQKDFTEPFEISSVDYTLLDDLQTDLIQQLITLHRIKLDLDCEVTYFEDAITEHADLSVPFGKLHRPVKWSVPFPEVSFDTEGLFT